MKKACLGAGTLLGSLALAAAATLNPGDTLPLPGTTSALNPNLGGTVVEDQLVPFSFSAYSGTVSGQVQVRVVHADDNTYDYYWRVFNDPNSAGAIGSFRIGEFHTSVYEANYRIDGLGDVAPVTATRFTGTFESYVNFNFSDLLIPGLSSKFMFLDGDATPYALVAQYDLANIGHTEISGSFPTFAPVVPEPATMALLGLGLAGVIIYRRRK